MRLGCKTEARLTAIVLTFNEELHIARCLESLDEIADRIVIIDSNSTDCTVDIAGKYGAEVFQHDFINQADQFQWALDNCGVDTPWTIRVDADEYLEPRLRQEILERLPKLSAAISGVYLRRKIVFLGRPIKHGFMYPLLVLRLFRTDRGYMEQRWMDEHIVVDPPETVTFQGDLTDENLQPLDWYIEKHNRYASREVREILTRRKQDQLSGASAQRRALRDRIYYNLPAGWRALAYFLFRYFVGLGFLDGREGLFFHFLQGCWYRLIVDAKLAEAKAVKADIE